MLGLRLIYKAITLLMTTKITKMALVNMYLTIGGVKIGVVGYTPECFSLWPHRSLVGPHFPYIIMTLEGGNSTEAT